jgi:FkbM family methyltransferase
MKAHPEIKIDKLAPWGTYAPSLVVARIISLCHSLSHTKGLQQLALWIRRLLYESAKTPYDIHVWGLKLRLYPRGSVSEKRILFTPGQFDLKERLFLESFLKKGDTFIDIGANVGGYSFWVFSVLGKNCKIYTIEPNPECQEKIRFNIGANHADNIKTARLILSETCGDGKLAVNQENSGESHLFEGGDNGNAPLVNVKMETLSSFAASHNIQQIHALKIDIEGHEYKVLSHFFSHSEKTIWPRVIITEVKDTKGHDSLKNLLETNGYRVQKRTKLNCIFKKTDR